MADGHDRRHADVKTQGLSAGNAAKLVKGDAV